MLMFRFIFYFQTVFYTGKTEVVEMLLQSPEFNPKTKPIHTPNVICNTDIILMDEPLHSKMCVLFHVSLKSPWLHLIILFI